MSKLHVIATPIGNRDDITLRALEALKKLTIFFVEDTREFRKLRQLYQIASPASVYALAKHNMKEAVERALALMTHGEDVGLVSDRGTPGISDPGALLVREVLKEGHSVVPVPGVSSVPTLLSVCGFDADRFIFLGFLPRQDKERDRLLEITQRLSLTICVFESPQRVRETVNYLKGKFPNSRIFVGREMTKVFESLTCHSLSQMDPTSLPERGEYVLAISPVPLSASEPDTALKDAIWLRTCSEKEWAKTLSQALGIKTSEIYNELQKEKRG